MNLREMTTKELTELLARVRAELDSRTSESEMVAYTHDCFGSARYHLGKYKHWAKKVDAVDITKSNGYAWKGEWLQVNAENMVPVGSLVVEVCGSDMAVYRATGHGEKAKIGGCSVKAPSELIRQVAELL